MNKGFNKNGLSDNGNMHFEPKFLQKRNLDDSGVILTWNTSRINWNQL